MTTQKTVDELFDEYRSKPMGHGSVRDIFMAGYNTAQSEITALKAENERLADENINMQETNDHAKIIGLELQLLKAKLELALPFVLKDKCECSSFLSTKGILEYFICFKCEALKQLRDSEK